MSSKGFFGPIELVMGFIAIVLDALSLIFALSGLCIFILPNLLISLGGAFLGYLMYIQTGSHLQKPQRYNKKIEKTSVKKKMDPKKIITRKILKRMGLGALIEHIPLIAGFIPIWTIAVFLHFKQAK